MAKNVFLEFESDIEALEGKIAELRELEESTADHEQRVSVDKEIQQLQKKATQLVKKVYADLTPWQISQVARHPNRPYTLDYIESIFTDFHELHGDRAFADDKAIVGGLARLANMNVVVIGHQKGRTLKERTERNFGMARPEGYRKALRLMEMAEKFGLPVVTLIDTPGAYPGIDAEERGQSEAIGHNSTRWQNSLSRFSLESLVKGDQVGHLRLGCQTRCSCSNMRLTLSLAQKAAPPFFGSPLLKHHALQKPWGSRQIA